MRHSLHRSQSALARMGHVSHVQEGGLAWRLQCTWEEEPIHTVQASANLCSPTASWTGARGRQSLSESSMAGRLPLLFSLLNSRPKFQVSETVPMRTCLSQNPFCNLFGLYLTKAVGFFVCHFSSFRSFPNLVWVSCPHPSDVQ